MLDYYEKKIYIPAVNENDEIQGRIERWEAHEKSILHRGFTIGVRYSGAFICQHRKHPLFDGYLDLTASSHPMYACDRLISSREMLLPTLKREWGIEPGELLFEPESRGAVLYESRDGAYAEHEVCELFIAEIDYLPDYNPDFAHGRYFLEGDEMLEKENLAPWVRAFMEEKLI